MTGNASALGGLFTGAADMAFMDRGVWATEHDAFQQGTGHDPFSVAVATGSLDVPHHAPALIIFVNRKNPLGNLSMAQLDGVFDADRRRGAAAIRTWGDLGLTGEWKRRPIHPYGYEILRRQSQHFEHLVMLGGQKWNCDLREVRGSGGAASAAIQQQVASDPDAIAFATLEARNPGVKALAIDGIAPSEATIASRQYALVQDLYIYLNRRPGEPIQPMLREFILYILSPQGRGVLEREHGYLPLPDQMAAQQREKLQ